MARRPRREARAQNKKRDKKADRGIKVPGIGGVTELIDRAEDSAIRTAEKTRDLNMVNESNPYGSSTYTKNPDGTITRNTTLSQSQDAIRRGGELQEQRFQDAASQSIGKFQDAASQGFNFDRLPTSDPRYTEMPSSDTRTKVENAYYDRGSRLLARDEGRAREATTADLRARGYQFGSPQYNNLMDQQVNERFDQQRRQLANDAILQGGAEEQRLNAMQLGTNAQNYGMGLQSRNQGINEQMIPRNQALQEIGAFRGFQTGTTNPAFNPFSPTNVQGIDVGGLGATWAGMQNDRYMQNKDQAFQRSLPRGGGGGAMGFHDWAQRQMFANQLQQENMLLANQLTPQQKQPSPWAQALPGLATGLGAAIGGLF